MRVSPALNFEKSISFQNEIIAKPQFYEPYLLHVKIPGGGVTSTSFVRECGATLLEN